LPGGIRSEWRDELFRSMLGCFPPDLFLDDGPIKSVPLERLLHAGITRAGYRIVETWDHLGLRASGSHDIVFDDVLFPLDHEIDVRKPDEWLTPNQRRTALSILKAGGTVHARTVVVVAVGEQLRLVGFTCRERKNSHRPHSFTDKRFLIFSMSFHTPG
jgi:alkylation response protein AidB-like acyl-CoA dehydrogenase